MPVCKVPAFPVLALPRFLLIPSGDHVSMFSRHAQACPTVRYREQPGLLLINELLARCDLDERSIANALGEER
jgi:hypothetical protein